MSAMDDFRKAIRSMVMESPRGLNCFALVMIEEIIRKGYLYNQENGTSSEVSCIQHPIFPSNTQFRYFPLSEPQDVEYHYDILAIIEWFKQGEDIHSFYRPENEQIANSESSYLINKLNDIATQFYSRLKIIRDDSGMGIPMTSLISMVSVMTCFRKNLVQNKIFPLLSDLDRERVQEVCSQDNISIPSTIPESQRDAYIATISNEIHKLLEEAFTVLMIAGLGVIREIESYLKRLPTPDLSEINEYLMRISCCGRMRINIINIKSMDEVKDYINNEYNSFYYIKPYLSAFVNGVISKSAVMKIHLRSKRVPRISPNRDIWDEEIKALLPSLSISPDFILTTSDTGEVTDLDTMDYESCINEEFERKFYNKPLNTYVLAGNLENILSHISAIINNCSVSVLEKEKNRVPGLNVSYRTMRRYRQQLKGNDANQETVTPDKTLIESDNGEETDVIGVMQDLKKIKSQAQKHQRPGYLSQNQLISKLSDDNYLIELHYLGKAYSRTALMKKIRGLIDGNEITVDREVKSLFFNENDLESIARKIYDLSPE